MRAKKSCAVTIFVGALLVVIFAVGLIRSRNPVAFTQKYRYDYTLDQFLSFCENWWLPAGIIGIPTLIGSLVLSLIREAKEKNRS